VSTSTVAPALRRLYFVRFGFALVWAGLLFTTASKLGPISVTLLVLYPLFDVVAALIDVRSSQIALGLYVNIAISGLAAIGLAVAAASGIPAVLRVWEPGQSYRASPNSPSASAAAHWAANGR
jgi:hypothetical protein